MASQFKLTCFLLLGAIALSSAAPSESVCETAVCKQIAADLKANINEALNPCDDFYEYVCANWMKANPLDGHSSGKNAFTIRNAEITHEVSAAMKAASTGSKSHAVAFLANLFLECNNTVQHNARGIKPLTDLLEKAVGGWPLTKKTAHTPSGQHWNKLFTNLFSHTGLSPIFRLAFGFQPALQKNVVVIGPGGTVLSPQILHNPTLYKKQYDAYVAYVKTAAILMGATDDAKLTGDIEKMIELETKIAHVLQVNPHNTIRMGSFSGLNVAMNNRINWVDWFNSILVETKSTTRHFTLRDTVGSANLEYLHSAAAVLDQSPEEVVHNLLAWVAVSTFGPVTTDKFRHEEALYRSAYTGVKSEAPEPEYCYAIANSKLPFVIARIYVDAHFTAADKAEAETLVNEIQASFQKVLQTNDWLDEETRTRALAKLAAIKKNVAYPAWVMADADLDNYYEQLKGAEVVKGEFFEAAVALNTRSVRHGLDTLYDKRNHTLLWPMTPATVNAAYMPTENSITIPAAVLKSPFFDRTRPISMNYGSIGAIIGHEMTHGFDNNGRRYDLHGEFKNWWTPGTVSKFTERSVCMKDQYGAIIEPTTHLKLNGALTLGENIADNGGVKESFNAYLSHSAKLGKSQVLPGSKFTADQLFFISWARNWCSVSRPEALAALIRTNPHPPERYRVNVVLGNTGPFSKAFNCPAGSKMNPTHKCSVW